MVKPLKKALVAILHLLTLSCGLALQARAANIEPELTSALRDYERFATEATEWLAEFQVAPRQREFGIGYHNPKVWGMGPYFYLNGTITGGYGGIPAGSEQKLLYLIGGHDAGLGAYVAYETYLRTRSPKHLQIFRQYMDYFRRSQINGTLDGENDGYWAEQANVDAGPDGKLGTVDDNVKVMAVFPSPEHGNMIALALILYFRLSGDLEAYSMLNKYGNWLVRLQITEGEFAGAFPVTREYFEKAGWFPRMFETSQSAWILVELYTVTRNSTYLHVAEKAGNYMLKRQNELERWNDSTIDGALPYEWNKTSYNYSPTTNHAGFSVLAWARLSQETRNTTFLYGRGGSSIAARGGAVKYADWLLRWQTTTPEKPWGSHLFSSDPYAVGGFFYSYSPEMRVFGRGTAQSLWGAAYAIRGLLLLHDITGGAQYLESARLAARWLTNMRFELEETVKLQALGSVKTVVSSWWGPYAQFYQPNFTEVERRGVKRYTEATDRDFGLMERSNRTWFEKTFEVDLNLIALKMVQRGERYMKMIWSWWPDVGFEPRYGGDVAFGLYSLSSYIRAHQLMLEAKANYEKLGAVKPTDSMQLLRTVKERIVEAEEQLEVGWYTPAMAFTIEAGNLQDELIASRKSNAPSIHSTGLILLLITGILIALWTLSVLRLEKKSMRNLQKQRIHC